MSEQLPRPEIDAVNAPYWEGLQQGRLLFQTCAVCGLRWLPPRSECPRCLADDPLWTQAGGRGRVLSWVVYHRALHPAFEQRLPYVVALVELEEGPRLMTNLTGVEPDALRADMPVRLQIAQEDGLALARFAAD